MEAEIAAILREEGPMTVASLLAELTSGKYPKASKKSILSALKSNSSQFNVSGEEWSLTKYGPISCRIL